MLKGAIVLDLDECLGEFRMLSTLYWALDQYEFKNLIGNAFDKNELNKIIADQVIEDAFRPGLKRFLLAINALKERINYKVILFTNHYNPPFTSSINDILKLYLGVNKFFDCIIDSGNKQRGHRFEKRLKDLIKIACNNNQDIPIIFYDDNPDWIEKDSKNPLLLIRVPKHSIDLTYNQIMPVVNYIKNISNNNPNVMKFISKEKMQGLNNDEDGGAHVNENQSHVDDIDNIYLPALELFIRRTFVN